MYACGKSHSRSIVLVASVLLGLLALALLATLLPGKARASQTGVLTVCPAGPPGCDYSDIQAAVDQAANGDAIKIAAGLYEGINDLGGLSQVVYISKTVTITGGYDTAFNDPPNPDVYQTVINAGGQGRVMYVAEGAEVVASGLRFIGGDAQGLGGDPGCEDQCTDYGGGIFVYSATLVLSNGEVHDNPPGYPVDGWVLGGGLSAREANVIIDDVQFFDNDATWGGGLAVYAGQALVKNSVLSGNSGYWGGGAWLCQGDVIVTFTGNAVSDNMAQEGGGLFTCASDVHITLDGNVISGNRAEQGGGVAVQYGSSITMINSVIRENEAGTAGSGFYADGGSSRLLHSTIAGNGGTAGSGIHLAGGRLALTNTILVEQSVGLYVAENGNAALEATLWGSGDSANGADWLGDGSILTGTVNLWGDPSLTGDGYHLTRSSAAIDNGVDAGVTIDMDGHLRPYGSGFDIGAIEYTLHEELFLPVVVR